MNSPPIFRTYFSGDWDVHWGLTDLDFDPWPYGYGSHWETPKMASGVLWFYLTRHQAATKTQTHIGAGGDKAQVAFNRRFRASRKLQGRIHGKRIKWFHLTTNSKKQRVLIGVFD